jgi:hypothetical protein
VVGSTGTVQLGSLTVVDEEIVVVSSSVVDVVQSFEGGRHFVPSIRIFLTQISRLHHIAWADCNDFLHCFFVF